MTLKYFSFLLFLSLTTNQTISQTITVNKLLENTKKTISNIKYVTYKINRTDKFFSSQDTISNISLCTLYLHQKNKLELMYITTKKSGSDSYNYEIFNGNEYSFINIPKDINLKSRNLFHQKLENDNYMYVNSNINVICLELFSKKSIFNKIKKNKNYKIIETKYLNIPAFELTITNKENTTEEIKDSVEKYFISKKDYLPLGYYFTGTIDGMFGYENYTIEYIEINPNMAPENFKTFDRIDQVNKKNILENILNHSL